MTIAAEIPDLPIHIPVTRIAALCEQFGVQELAVFGSVLTDRFTAKSDVDFLVVFRNDDYGPWACKLTQLQDALAAELGRKVDLVSRQAVTSSPNYLRREQILTTARTLYVA